MSRWRTAYRSRNKRVLVRNRPSGYQKSGESVPSREDEDGWVTVLGWAAVAFLILVAIAEFWPWLVVAGLAYGVLVGLGGQK